MAKVDEVRQNLDIPAGTWGDYIKNGVIEKKKVGQYDSFEVAKQIIRWQRSTISKANGAKIKHTHAVKKLEDEISRLTGDNNPESTESRKKNLDIELLKRRIAKMDMDNMIRKKDYIPIELLRDIVTKLASETAGRLDPIPMKIKRLIPDIPATVLDGVKMELAKTRNMMARYEVGDVVSEFLRKFDPENDEGIDDGN